MTSYFKGFVLRRVRPQNRNSLLVLLPPNPIPLRLKHPILGERPQHPTPKPTTQPPHPQLIRKQRNVRPLRTHLDNRLVGVGSLVFEIDGTPYGARSQAVYVEMVGCLD